MTFVKVVNKTKNRGAVAAVPTAWPSRGLRITITFGDLPLHSARQPMAHPSSAPSTALGPCILD